MPRRDGTGPLGLGAYARRGLGYCVCGEGAGLPSVCRRKFSHGLKLYAADAAAPRALLKKQKELLERRLDIVNKQLENS